MSKKISIIVAASANLVIGRNNDLPWKLPTDMKNFKKITEGYPVIMGRKSWESLPPKFRPLPNRVNVVLTSDTNKDNYKNAIIVRSLEEALNIFDSEVFIIGGAQLYKEAFKYADKLYFTEIFNTIEGDTYLEGFNINDWKPIYESEVMEENGIEFIFSEYIKV